MPLELRELVVTAEIVGDSPEAGPSSDRTVSPFRNPDEKRQLIREVAECVLEALTRRKED